jgi:hypothetical protein
MSEKRSDRRQPLHHRCWIVVAADDPGTLAHVSDISESGAKLNTESPADVPDEFTLRLRVNRACRVVWRKDNDIGINFSRIRAL